MTISNTIITCKIDYSFNHYSLRIKSIQITNYYKLLHFGKHGATITPLDFVLNETKVIY
jgi:hypothetical protein